MTKKIWLWAIIFWLAFGGSIVFGSLSNQKDYSQKSENVESIDFGYSNWSGWWLWEIAKEEGLFAKNGANVNLKWYDSYSDSLTALAAGHLDANCQTLNDTITRAEQAVDGEVVVLVNDYSAGNDKIIVSQEIKEVKDLKEKRVALEEGVVDDFLLTLALKENGMGREDVEIFNLETGAATLAFARGQVDAVGAFPPFWLDALSREGAHELISSQDFPGAIPDLLVVTQKLVDEKPEQVQALVNTWFDILDFIKKNPQRADEIIASRAGIELSQLELFKSGVKLLNREDNLAAFKVGNSMTHLNHAARKIAEFYREEFAISLQNLDLKGLFNSTFIKKSNHDE